MENDLAIAEEIKKQYGIKPGFSVNDEASLDWVTRQINTANSLEAILETQYKHRKEELAKIRNLFISLYGNQMKEFVISHADHGKKSMTLLSGTVSVRTVPETFFIADEDKFLEWALEHLPEALKEKTMTSIDKKKVEEYFKKTGEVPAGCDTKPAEERVYVKAGKNSNWMRY
jgi:hypothetical protein